MDETQDELLTRLNYAVFGVRGDNGLLGSMKALTEDFHAYEAKEEARRADDINRARAKDRTLVLTAIGALVSALGVIVTLVVVLVNAS